MVKLGSIKLYRQTVSLNYNIKTTPSKLHRQNYTIELHQVANPLTYSCELLS